MCNKTTLGLLYKLLGAAWMDGEVSPSFVYVFPFNFPFEAIISSLFEYDFIANRPDIDLLKGSGAFLAAVTS